MELQPPSELGLPQVHRQARWLLRHTSRARNRNWYRSAFQQDRQWHLWFDGGIPVSAVFDAKKGRWHEGPAPVFPGGPAADHPDTASGESPDENARKPGDAQGLHHLIRALLKGPHTGGRARSLGIVLHLADEFTLAELAPDVADDDNFRAVSEFLINDPAEALSESRVDESASSWRLLPFWGLEESDRRSVAVSVSRRYQAFAEEATRYGESLNTPVIVSGVSAPLEALRLTPLFLDEEDASAPGFLFVYQYRRFTVLAALDEKRELLTLRVLHHPGGDCGQELGGAIMNISAAVGLAEFEVYIVTLSEVSSIPLILELRKFFQAKPAMSIGLISFSDIESVEAIPGKRVEMLAADAATLKRLDRDAATVTTSRTFRELARGWATQNFYGRSRLQESRYPGQRDLKLLSFFGLLRNAAALGLLFLSGVTALEFTRAQKKPSWRLTAPEQEATVARLTELSAMKARSIYWENLLARRSEGWLALEVLLTLFPEDSGLVVTNCSYRTSALQPRRGAIEKRAGFKREWSFEGYARTGGRALLGRLSSQNHVEAEFARMAETYGADSLLDKAGSRKLSVLLEQRQGRMPASERFPPAVAETYRTRFELSISQEFSSRDDLAIVREPPSIP